MPARADDDQVGVYFIGYLGKMLSYLTGGALSNVQGA